MNYKVIYTVLTGGYDDLCQPDTIKSDWDYICFSNDIEETDIGVWKIRKFDYCNSNKTRESRFPKLNPHLVLPDYDYSLYVDANVAIRDCIYQRCNELIGAETNLAMVHHAERDCVYQEAMILTAWKVAEPDLIYRQTKFLLQQHFPQHHGLFIGTVIFRKHNAPVVIRFSKLWWEFYSRCSSRDQMAVSYALMQTGIAPKILFPSTFYNENICPHKKKRRGIANFTFHERLEQYFAIFRMKMLFWRYRVSVKKKLGDTQ